VEPCELDADPCIVYYPTGQISWTFDRSGWGEPTDCHDQGTADAGLHAVTLSDQQLILWPDGQGGYTYSGHGIDVEVESQGCHVDLPVNYFEVIKYDNYQVSGDLQTIQGQNSYPGSQNDLWEYGWSFSAAACPQGGGVCQ